MGTWGRAGTGSHARYSSLSSTCPSAGWNYPEPPDPTQDPRRGPVMQEAVSPARQGTRWLFSLKSGLYLKNNK